MEKLQLSKICCKETREKEDEEEGEE